MLNIFFVKSQFYFCLIPNRVNRDANISAKQYHLSEESDMKLSFIDIQPVIFFLLNW